MKNEAVIGGIVVAGQPTQDELTSGRFKKIVNIRRDDEEGNISASALAGTGVDYTDVPWTIDTVTPADIHRMRDAIGDESGVLIH